MNPYFDPRAAARRLLGAFADEPSYGLPPEDGTDGQSAPAAGLPPGLDERLAPRLGDGPAALLAALPPLGPIGPGQDAPAAPPAPARRGLMGKPLPPAGPAARAPAPRLAPPAPPPAPAAGPSARPPAPLPDIVVTGRDSRRIGAMTPRQYQKFAAAYEGREGKLDHPPRPRDPSPGMRSAISLTPADILNLKKTLQTEWVPSAGDDQAKGIVDTILNRLASGHFGLDVSDVVNQYKQFSDINGGVAWKRGRHSVEDYPAARVSRRASDLVDAYLAARAAGQPSIVDNHLNYANLVGSDPVNLGWIRALDGPRLGRGKAVHRHGTTPENQRWRPRPYAIQLPGR